MATATTMVTHVLVNFGDNDASAGVLMHVDHDDE